LHFDFRWFPAFRKVPNPKADLLRPARRPAKMATPTPDEVVAQLLGRVAALEEAQDGYLSVDDANAFWLLFGAPLLR
jgi:hypothetical protein